MAEITSAIGEEGARRLSRKFGGISLDVPRIIGEHHPLYAVLGPEVSAKLASSHGGGRIYVPKQAERRQRVLDLCQAGGLTNQAIALETGISERHVYRLKEKRPSRHPDLFEENDTP